MAAQIIPLTNASNQTLTTQLVVNNTTLTLGLSVGYNEMAGYWDMQINDANGVELIASVPLITGIYPAGNILGQYEFLQIGEAYLLNTGSFADDYPGASDLTSYALLWTDNS